MGNVQESTGMSLSQEIKKATPILIYIVVANFTQ